MLKVCSRDSQKTQMNHPIVLAIFAAKEEGRSIINSGDYKEIFFDD